MSSEFGEKAFKFEELIVYQKSLDYVNWVYDLAKKFPNNENFGLTSQFQRAACSISLNIAEGSGGTKTEFQNFLRIARRSVRECVVCAAIAERRKYISKADESASRSFCLELSRMISGLSNSLG